MHLKYIKLSNFRRLANVVIDLDQDISILVGANNSGKTSVAQAMHLFLSGTRDRMSLYDISASRWPDIESFAEGIEGTCLPTVSLDLWFEVAAPDLHRVIDLLPSLAWQASLVGVRIEFGPMNAAETLARFRDRHGLAQEAARAAGEAIGINDGFIASPKNLTEFLTGELGREYEFRYFVLDRAKFDDDLKPDEGYQPLELIRDQGRGGKEIINSLLKVDFLHAQRHLSDMAGGSRAEELSRHLSRFYSRNLDKRGEDFRAIRALAESELSLNEHLAQVFAEMLERLASLGYPGIANPRLVIKSALNPATVMASQDGAHVHYALDDRGLTLPDKYNGLGFKNLIYMVVELLDLHAQWANIEDERPALHLIFIEEPEAHLHAQLQQVFINKVLDILTPQENEAGGFRSQLVLTTHSPHILYERGFRPIRYFRRERQGADQCTTVVNLSEFYRKTENPSRDFLERYLKQTHCDLFFADAAILVEGNVERLLMPLMIAEAAPALKSRYLSVLEIGGAFGHCFETLIDYLGITTLIITDLDSVYGPQPAAEAAADGADAAGADANDAVAAGAEDDEEGLGPGKPGKTCPPETGGSVTSNQMLIQWLPQRTSIQELLELTPDRKCVPKGPDRLSAVRVTYPSTVEVSWQGEKAQYAGRTLEEAFAFENLAWTQEAANQTLGLRIRGTNSVAQIVSKLHRRIHGSGFKKTDFALALLTREPGTWAIPAYIREGLEWLEGELRPVPVQDDEPQREAA